MTSHLSIPFLLPITITDDENEKATPIDLVDISCSRAQATCLAYWNLPPGSSDIIGITLTTGGIAMGCEDGSLFVFHSVTRGIPRIISPTSPQMRALRADRPPSTSSSRGSSPLRRSHSPSPSISSVAPFNISSRSRIVAGVTREQAQAPKNYVDFDDEPDKLKGMLKSGGGVRERTVIDGIMPNLHHDLVVSGRAEKEGKRPLLQAEVSTPGEDGSLVENKQQLSYIRSLPLSNIPLSPPQSPPVPSEVSESPLLVLQYHVVFPGPSNSGAVRAVEYLQDVNQLLVLQAHGQLLVCDAEDGSCITSLRCPGSWTEWTRLNVFRVQERIVAVIGGRPLRTRATQPHIESGREETHCLLVEYFSKHVAASSSRPPFLVIEDIFLKGSWTLSYNVQLISDESISLLYINDEQRVTACTISIAPGYSASSKEMPVSDNSLGLLDRHILKNPFKGLKLHSHEHLPLSESDTSLASEAVKQQVHSMETELWHVPDNEHVSAVALRQPAAGVRGAITVQDGLLIFISLGSQIITTKASIPGSSLRLHWIDDNDIALYYSDRIDVWILNINGHDLKLEKKQSLPSYPSQVSIFQSSHEMLRTYLEPNQARTIILESVTGSCQMQALWRANKTPGASGHATCVLPLGTELVVGYDDGFIRRFSIFQLGSSSATTTSSQSANHSLGGSVLHLEIVDKSLTRKSYIVGGADDGSVAVWDQQTLELVSRWTLFTTPLIKLIHISEAPSGRLKDSIICISQDGTIAFVTLDGPYFMFLVPGSEAPLAQIHIDAESLWLTYKDGLARQWDIKSREFRRSTNRDRTPELLNPGPWMHWDVDTMILPKAAIQRLDIVTEALDSASVLSFNLVDLFESNLVMQATAESPDSHPPILTSLKTALSGLLTFGLNEEIDRICEEKMGVHRTAMRAGLQRSQSITLFKYQDARNAWSISSRATTVRLVGIITALKTWINLGHVPENANTVLLFYATSLAHSVGTAFKPPSIALLARYWLESSSEIRQAIRLALDSELARIEDAELVALADNWQDQLPSIQTDAYKSPLQAAIALFICGQIAVAKFSLLSTTTLIALSKSIAIYLHDDDDLHRALAIDLCARGFDVWQNHADAMDLLRALFQMAALPSKKDITAHNIGTQARHAIVHIATHNAPLFTTTLSIEILQPQSLQDRRSVMQILAYLVRKKPMVVYASLPRLIEAVVKSLDPTSTSERDAVFDAATEILGHVVQRFPTVDFHSATQRLAVGTGEGAIVMYDLKTATRLYVLDGHKKRNVGCSFSPDGRRLVTLSLEESVALVWKVGSSFSNFFYPGAPPRQGHSGSDPFKTYPFNIGPESQMSLAETLELVGFEWPTEKSVKVKIRTSTLTFSTQ